MTGVQTCALPICDNRDSSINTREGETETDRQSGRKTEMQRERELKGVSLGITQRMLCVCVVCVCVCVVCVWCV